MEDITDVDHAHAKNLSSYRSYVNSMIAQSFQPTKG